MIANTIYLGAFGPTEYILIIAVILLLFGGKKIPELISMYSVGPNAPRYIVFAIILLKFIMQI